MDISSDYDFYFKWDYVKFHHSLHNDDFRPELLMDGKNMNES